MFKQARTFNQSTAGTTTGYCLQNVRRGYNIPSKYPTAIDAWTHTQQHKDRSWPSGDVPLFYTYGQYGHINVRLSNGRVWSDGSIYNNLDDYLTKHTSVHYLGWGESINDLRVYEWVADPPKPSLPPVGSKIHLIPTQTRTTWKAGTSTQAGTIHVTDNTFNYVVRGYDSKYPGRAIINSASGGGDGVGLALYFVSGAIVDGWTRV